MKIPKFFNQKESTYSYISAFLIPIFIFLTIRYQYKLLSCSLWVDESETIVGAKMLSSGMRLYSEVFTQHGPLVFIPGYLLELIGNFGIPEHRVIIAILQIAAIISVYQCPILEKKFIPYTYSTIVFSIIVLYLPNIFGQMYLYQNIAGLFFLIIFSLYTLPSLISPDKVSSLHVFIGNLLLFSIPFLAISYLPAVIFLYIASLRKPYLRASLLAALYAILLNLFFLWLIGSFKGYFAYHFYLNFKILPQYVEWVESPKMIYVAFWSMTKDLNSFILFSGVITFSLLLSRYEKYPFPFRTILISLSLGTLLMRGIEFQALPFFYIFLSLPLVYLSKIKKVDFKSFLFVFFFQIVCLVKLSIVIPSDLHFFKQNEIPESTSFSRLVKKVTNEDDRIIAYTFNNFEYIASERLPASGHYFYLPWQEHYNRFPILGIYVNPCDDIKKNKPKVMLIDKWEVVGTHTWSSYGQCIDKIIETDYKKIKNHPFYLRNDITLTSSQSELFD